MFFADTGSDLFTSEKEPFSPTFCGFKANRSEIHGRGDFFLAAMISLKDG